MQQKRELAKTDKKSKLSVAGESLVQNDSSQRDDGVHPQCDTCGSAVEHDNKNSLVIEGHGQRPRAERGEDHWKD